MEIDEVDFPAVSVCHPVSWTWPSLLSLLHTIDSNGTVIKQIFSESITDDEYILLGVLIWQVELIKAEGWDILSWNSLRQSEFINEENEDTFYFLHFMVFHLFGNMKPNYGEVFKLGRLYYAWKSYDFIDATNKTALKNACTCSKYPNCNRFCSDQELELFQTWTEAMSNLTDSEEKVEFHDQICSVGKFQAEINRWCNSCFQPAQICIYDDIPFYYNENTNLLYIIRLSTLRFKTMELLEIFYLSIFYNLKLH